VQREGAVHDRDIAEAIRSRGGNQQHCRQVERITQMSGKQRGCGKRPSGQEPISCPAR
jgi:hypothetical protein